MRGELVGEEIGGGGGVVGGKMKEGEWEGMIMGGKLVVKMNRKMGKWGSS